MSDKNAPPITEDQKRFETFYKEIMDRRFEHTTFGRDKNGVYFARGTQDAWLLWQKAQERYVVM